MSVRGHRCRGQLHIVPVTTDYDKQRLMVKPGATGMWQVGGRNDVDFDEMVKLDLTYIQERSVWLDLKIMFETVKVMIIPNGAY